MKAETEDLIDLMFDNRRQYQIPVYQRNYDWKKDNCIVLYNDIINAYEKEKRHFLGTIVQVSQDDINGIKQYLIIDGQQRTTSIYLLLKALYDSAKNEDDKDELEGYIFNSSSSKEYSIGEKNKLKLKPIKSDNEQFIYLMSNKLDNMDKLSNIYINYNVFKEQISKSLANGYSIKNIIKGLKYLQIVMISLKETNDGQGDDPQIVFERINSTGEDLTLADLIRNYVLMTDKNREYLFENYWLVMEDKVGKDNLVDYFMNYLTFKLPEQVNARRAYQLFKEYADNKKISNEEILIELKRYSKYYTAFINENNQNYSKEIVNLLTTFRILQQSTIYPLFFSIFDDFENEIISEKELIEILRFFLNYTIRRMIVGVPSNSLRGLYKTLYKRIFNGTDKSDYFNKVLKFMTSLNATSDAIPNDTSFKEELMYGNMYRNSKLCKYILTILENGNFDAKETVKIDSSITIEHIMPQNKNEEWQTEVGDDYFVVYEKYLHTLGNLTLTGYNSELSDKSFEDKKKMIIENSKFIFLNKDVVNKEKWNVNSITERAERLSSILISCFKLPSTILETKTSLNQFDKHTVMDRMDLRGTKPISCILQGECRNVSSYRELLISTITMLYQFNPIMVETLAKRNYRIPGAEKVYISYVSDLLRTPEEIENSGIYIETNLSANVTISFVRAVLSEFDLLNDDFVFYVNNLKQEV